MAGRVFKRKDTYHIAFSYKGVEYRKSALTDKKREAENHLAFYLGQCARGEFKGFQDDRVRYTVSEMLEDLFNDCVQRKLRSIKAIKSHMSPLHQAFGTVTASDLTERQIDLYVKRRFAADIAPATLNYEMHYLQRSFRMAQRKKLVETVPHIPRFPVHNARQGFFEKEDFERVVSYLPDYLQDFARFAYLTGWRFGEITTLEWRDIQDGTIRLRPEVSKNWDGRVLIVVGALAELVERRSRARMDLLPQVFHRHGVKINRCYKAWRSACRSAGVPGKLFHDLRRTAVRNMIRAGVPERIAMAISGHKTRSVFDRYNIVNEDDIRQGLLKTQAYIAQEEQHGITPLFSGTIGHKTHTMN